jgi:uncharacterized protein YndB with AHSA1/START domain
MTIADATRVEVRRRLPAPPQKVFAAFSEASLITRWLTPSPDITLSVLQFDFRQGGAYRFAYRLPHGHTVIIGGLYQTIEPPSKIVFSWDIEPPDEHAGIKSLVTVTITPQAHGSELVILHEKLSRPDAVVRHAEGWRGALDLLTALFDKELSSHDR